MSVGARMRRAASGLAAGGGLGTYAEEVAADSPFAWWRLEETSGTSAADETGNGHTGTVTGADLNVSGASGTGSAASFDGVDDYIDVGTLGSFGSSLGSGVSVELLAKWTSTSSSIGPLGTFNDGSNTALFAQCNRDTPGTIYLSFRAEGGPYRARRSSRTDLNDGNFHHVAFTWAGGSADVDCYVDGVLDNGLTNNSGTPETFSNFGYALFAGGRNFEGSVNLPFPGDIDEFAIYQSVLSAARILVHAQAAGVA